MMISGAGREFIIKDTHRGLYYEDGKLTKVIEAGRYKIPRRHRWLRRRPTVECMLVDVREREMTIKGQEILTADKVAIRVSILVQFRVTDPKAAIHTVDNFEDRLYSDVQLAARRSLASMTLEEVLTNRNRLSEDILSDVTESANGYGVAIRRADVKDLIFPGNLQEIMNRVLAAERHSQAQRERERKSNRLKLSHVRRPRVVMPKRKPMRDVCESRPKRKRRARRRSRKRKRTRNESRQRRRWKDTRYCCDWPSSKRYVNWPRTPTRDCTSVSTEIGSA